MDPIDLHVNRDPGDEIIYDEERYPDDVVDSIRYAYDAIIPKFTLDDVLRFHEANARDLGQHQP